MKFARYGIAGIVGSGVFGVGSFALTSIGVPWLAIIFLAPGALLSIAVAATSQAVLPLSTQQRIMNYAGDGPGPFVGLMLIVAFGIWAVLIGVGYWWVSRAPEE